ARLTTMPSTRRPKLSGFGGSAEGPGTASVTAKSSLCVDRLEPRQHRPRRPLHHLHVDVGQDGLAEGMPHLLVFARAVLRALLRQPAVLAHEILEPVRVAAIGEAEEGVLALQRGGMRSPEARLRALALVPAVGLALDQHAREVAAELQHDESGDLVGGVL